MPVKETVRVIRLARSRAMNTRREMFSSNEQKSSWRIPVANCDRLFSIGEPFNRALLFSQFFKLRVFTGGSFQNPVNLKFNARVLQSSLMIIEIDPGIL